MDAERVAISFPQPKRYTNQGSKRWKVLIWKWMNMVAKYVWKSYEKFGRTLWPHPKILIFRLVQQICELLQQKDPPKTTQSKPRLLSQQHMLPPQMWMWEVPKSTTPTGAQVGRQSKSWSRLVSPPQQSWLWIRIESMSALHTKHWSKWIDQLLYLVRPGGFPPSHGCVYCWLHLRVNLEQVGCPRRWEVLHDEKNKLTSNPHLLIIQHCGNEKRCDPGHDFSRMCLTACSRWSAGSAGGEKHKQHVDTLHSSYFLRVGTKHDQSTNCALQRAVCIIPSVSTNITLNATTSCKRIYVYQVEHGIRWDFRAQWREVSKQLAKPKQPCSCPSMWRSQNPTTSTCWGT